MNEQETEIIEKALGKIEKELIEAYHRTPSSITAKQNIYNAYQLVLSLQNIIHAKKQDTL